MDQLTEDQNSTFPGITRKLLVDGEQYEALVPDTLNLVERAEYAINALIGQVEPKFDYECWWRIILIPPSVDPHSCQWHDQNTRNLWSLTLLRLMGGCTYGLDIEEKMIESMLSRVGEDGFYYNAPFSDKNAWWRDGGASRIKKWSVDDDIALMQAQAMMLYVMISRYLRDGD